MGRGNRDDVGLPAPVVGGVVAPADGDATSAAPAATAAAAAVLSPSDPVVAVLRGRGFGG